MLNLKIYSGLILAIAFFYAPLADAQETEEPELKIEIRQSRFHDDFTRRELRVYRIFGPNLSMVAEAFDDAEAEISLERTLNKANLRQLKNVIERNRVMDREFGCEMISRDTRTKLKTQIRIAYKGREITCYSFDQPFSRQLEDVLKAINRMLPAERYKLAIPSYNPRIKVDR